LGVGAVEDAEVPAALQLAALLPDLGLVDLAVVRVEDGAALVAILVATHPLDDLEPDDRLVLVFAGARRALLRLALSVVGIGQADDLAVEFAALIVELDLRDDLAALLVDRLPLTRRRSGRKGDGGGG